MGYMSDVSEQGFPTVKLPKWIKNMPKEVRPYVEQEYYVDPQQAELFAECKTYADVKACRRELSHLYHLPESRDLDLDFTVEGRSAWEVIND